jgi:four helix bundle protein
VSFKFERLEVWQLALDYIDLVYEIAEQLPRSEEYNLKSQVKRAATSMALNIAEGSTGQPDAEQARFLGLALRSLLETVACQHLISRRDYLPDATTLRQAYRQANVLAAKPQAVRNPLVPNKAWAREASVLYESKKSDLNHARQATHVVHCRSSVVRRPSSVVNQQTNITTPQN